MDTNSPVYHALMKRRSEIAGGIDHLEIQVARLKQELVHVDATLGIMGFDVPNLKIRAKAACTSGLFHKGELIRLILEKLRNCENGMIVSDITNQIAMDKGWEMHDKRFITALREKVSRQLCKMKRRYGVCSERVGDEWIWEVK